jgi:hypothetical protein
VNTLRRRGSKWREQGKSRRKGRITHTRLTTFKRLGTVSKYSQGRLKRLRGKQAGLQVVMGHRY